MAKMMDSPAGTAWSRLAHAYGPAEDTPAHLAGLLDPDPQANRRGLDHLWSAILHQGTVYPATAPAVVLVAHTLAEASEEVRRELLAFLAEAGRSFVENATEGELLSFSCPPGKQDRLAWVTEGHYEEIDDEDEDAELVSVMMARAMLAGRQQAPVIVQALQPWRVAADPEIAAAAERASSRWSQLLPDPAAG